MYNTKNIELIAKTLIKIIVPQEFEHFDHLFEFIKDEIGFETLLSLKNSPNQTNPQSDLGFYNNDTFLTSTDLIKIGTYISQKSFQNNSIRTKEELKKIIDNSIKVLEYPQWLHNKVRQCLEDIYMTISGIEIQEEVNLNQIEVILNGYKKTVSEIELSNFRRDTSFDLIIEERRKTIWVYGKEYRNFTTKKKPFGVLKMISQVVPETTISFEDIFEIVWLGDPKIYYGKSMRNQINTRIRLDIKTLGSKSKTLENVIETVGGIGIRTSPNIKTLLIPHTSKYLLEK